MENATRFEESARLALTLCGLCEVVEGLALVEHIGDDNRRLKLCLRNLGSECHHVLPKVFTFGSPSDSVAGSDESGFRHV